MIDERVRLPRSVSVVLSGWVWARCDVALMGDRFQVLPQRTRRRGTRRSRFRPSARGESTRARTVPFTDQCPSGAGELRPQSRCVTNRCHVTHTRRYSVPFSTVTVQILFPLRNKVLGRLPHVAVHLAEPTNCTNGYTRSAPLRRRRRGSSSNGFPDPPSRGGTPRDATYPTG